MGTSPMGRETVRGALGEKKKSGVRRNGKSKQFELGVWDLVEKVCAENSGLVDEDGSNHMRENDDRRGRTVIPRESV